jgi:hypothetical protein
MPVTYAGSGAMNIGVRRTRQHGTEFFRCLNCLRDVVFLPSMGADPGTAPIFFLSAITRLDPPRPDLKKSAPPARMQLWRPGRDLCPARGVRFWHWIGNRLRRDLLNGDYQPRKALFSHRRLRHNKHRTAVSRPETSDFQTANTPDACGRRHFPLVPT